MMIFRRAFLLDMMGQKEGVRTRRKGQRGSPRVTEGHRGSLSDESAPITKESGSQWAPEIGIIHYELAILTNKNWEKKKISNGIDIDVN